MGALYARSYEVTPPSHSHARIGTIHWATNRSKDNEVASGLR